MTNFRGLDIATRASRFVPWLILILVFALFGLPIIMLFWGAFRDTAPGQPGGWSLQGFQAAFQDSYTIPSYLNSVMLGLSMGGLGTAIAAVLAYVNARSRTLFARLMTPLMVISLVVPPLFFALSWDLLGTPGVGVVNELLQPLGFPPLDISGALGTIFVGGLKVAPLVYFILLGPFRSMDHRLEEASRISGAGWLATFVHVTLPTLAPAILGGFIIAFVIGLTAFDIPLIVGLPDGFNVFSTQIYGFLNETSPPNYAGAGSLAIVLVASVIAVVALRWWLLDRRSFATVGGKSGGMMMEEGKALKVVGAVAFFITAILTLVLPVSQMVVASFQGSFGSYVNFSFGNYSRILNDPFVADMLMNTMVVSVLGGFLAVALAFSLALIGRYAGTFMRRALDLLTWLPWAANGILLGLGLVWLFLTVPALSGAFGTIWILLLGLVVASTPLASRAIEGALAQISGELEEAGRISGASVMRVSIDIVLRLMLPAFLSGWFISAIHIVGNLEVPILLSMPSNQTLSVAVYRLYANGQTTQAAALFCLVLLFIVAVGAVIWLLLQITRKLLALPKRTEQITTAGQAAGGMTTATKFIAQQAAGRRSRKN